MTVTKPKISSSVTIIWGFNCLIKNVNVIIIIAPLFHLWKVCPMQGWDDISPQTFCHNLLGGMSPFNIQYASINVWSFIVLFTYKNNCYLINQPFPSSNLMCGRVLNRLLKTGSWKLPRWLVLTPHQFWASRVLDTVGTGWLVHG